MGGAVSLFDRNDWKAAHGKIYPYIEEPSSEEGVSVGDSSPMTGSSGCSSSSPSMFPSNLPSILQKNNRKHPQTVDGANPTAQYGVYWLIKRGAFNLNQREYDITDDACNLLYTTKIVPGTIACFDVIDGHTNQNLLRVSVDISRRYWSVYRFKNPMFEGQLPDKMATHQLFMNDSKFQHEFMNYQYRMKQLQARQLKDHLPGHPAGHLPGQSQDQTQDQPQDQTQNQTQNQSPIQTSQQEPPQHYTCTASTLSESTPPHYHSTTHRTTISLHSQHDKNTHHQCQSPTYASALPNNLSPNTTPSSSYLTSEAESPHQHSFRNTDKDDPLQHHQLKNVLSDFQSPDHSTNFTPEVSGVANLSGIEHYDPSLGPPPGLFKACCITVSWSRYMAVSTMYGPPSDSELMQYNSYMQDTRFLEEQQRLQKQGNGTSTSNPLPTPIASSINSTINMYKKEQLISIAKSYLVSAANATSAGATAAAATVTGVTSTVKTPRSSGPITSSFAVFTDTHGTSKGTTTESTTDTRNSLTSTLRQQKSLADDLLDEAERAKKCTRNFDRKRSMEDINYEVELVSYNEDFRANNAHSGDDDDHDDDDDDESNNSIKSINNNNSINSISSIDDNNNNSNNSIDHNNNNNSHNIPGVSVLAEQKQKDLDKLKNSVCTRITATSSGLPSSMPYTVLVNTEVNHCQRDANSSQSKNQFWGSKSCSLNGETRDSSFSQSIQQALDVNEARDTANHSLRLRCLSEADSGNHQSLAQQMFHTNLDDFRIDYVASQRTEARQSNRACNSWTNPENENDTTIYSNVSTFHQHDDAKTLPPSLHSSISAASASIANIFSLGNSNEKEQDVSQGVATSSITTQAIKNFVNKSVATAGKSTLPGTTDTSTSASSKMNHQSNEETLLSPTSSSKSATKVVRIAFDDPREGTIDMDNKPILLCQEIYTRIIGNWQTSRITKAKALELLKRDMLQHEKEEVKKSGRALNAASTAYNGSIPGMRRKSQSQLPKSMEEKDNANALILSLEQQVLAEASIEMQQTHDGCVIHLTDLNSSKDQAHAAGLSIRTSEDEDNTIVEYEQPLIGYWNWENTLRTHKMKMHVAAGSDLALHVVMAILVNQVRYERNAIALVA